MSQPSFSLLQSPEKTDRTLTSPELQSGIANKIQDPPALQPPIAVKVLPFNIGDTTLHDKNGLPIATIDKSNTFLAKTLMDGVKANGNQMLSKDAILDLYKDPKMTLPTVRATIEILPGAVVAMKKTPEQVKAMDVALFQAGASPEQIAKFNSQMDNVPQLYQAKQLDHILLTTKGIISIATGSIGSGNVALAIAQILSQGTNSSQKRDAWHENYLNNQSNLLAGLDQLRSNPKIDANSTVQVNGPYQEASAVIANKLSARPPELSAADIETARANGAKIEDFSSKEIALLAAASADGVKGLAKELGIAPAEVLALIERDGKIDSAKSVDVIAGGLAHAAKPEDFSPQELALANVLRGVDSAYLGITPEQFTALLNRVQATITTSANLGV
jgi:hypothetical protein